MSLPDQDLSSHLVQPFTEADLDRQWRRLAAALIRPAPRAPLLFAVGGALAVAGVIAFFVVVGRPQKVALPSSPAVKGSLVAEGSRVETLGATPRTVELTDGSHIVLGANAALALLRDRPDEVRVALDRGSADFDVMHVAGRRFVVAAAEVEVVVVGTRFVVSVSDGAQGKTAAVSVTRGAVEVRRPLARSLLLAGESWASATPAQPPEATQPPAAPPTDEPPALGPPAARAPAPRAPVKAAVDDARSLFAVATRARVQGRNRQAAAALETLCRKFPEDPRAALAALELGRIRLDTLHEPALAAVAFRMAMNLAGETGLREDAATRYIEALDRKGDAAACRAAREAYLSEYPTGPHVGSVTGACRGR